MVTFTSPVNWNGEETVTFTVSDALFEDFASVVVIVDPMNDPPTIEDLPDSLTFSEDNSLVVDFEEYVDDIDADDLSLGISGNDSITANIVGFQITFGAVTDWNGTETLTFSVNDNQGREIAEDDIDVIVMPVEDAPVADDQVVTTDEDVAVDIVLTGSDPDQDDIYFTLTTLPFYGTLVGTAPNLTYTPNLNVYGTDAFTFSVSGNNIFAATTAAGPDITDAANKCLAKNSC